MHKATLSLILLELTLTTTLFGCASSKEDIFPQDMRPMREVYDGHFSQLQTTSAPREPARLAPDAAFYPGTSSGKSPSGVNGSPDLSVATSDRQDLSPAVHASEQRAQLDEQTRYARDAKNEIDALFPVLPNPHLVMYVYPHLSEDDAPVPGYATSFPLYEKPEYALPGETR